MDFQERLLDTNYLQARLRDLQYVRRGEVRFDIEQSNRINSKSLYINFYCYGQGRWYKQRTLRVSDHFIKDCVHTQFIVKTGHALTKKCKDNFIKAVDKEIGIAKRKNLQHEFKKLSGESNG